MTIPFSDKTMFTNGSAGNRPEVIFSLNDGDGDYFRHSVPVSGIQGIVECAGNLSALKIAGYAEPVEVAMTFDALRQKIKEAADFGEDLDLQSCTGQKYVETKYASLASVFDAAAKGTRRSDEDFEFIFFGNEDQDECAEENVEEISVSSSDINYFEKGSDYDDMTYIDTSDNGYFVRLPMNVVEQFYTHGRRNKYAEIDLKEITDPDGHIQMHPEMLRKIPKLYARVSKPGA